MFYYCANSKDMSIIYFFSIILKELLEYYEVDIEQFEDYDQILSFLKNTKKEKRLEKYKALLKFRNIPYEADLFTWHNSDIL